MANTLTDSYLGNNKQYASGQAVHKPNYPGKLEEVRYPGPMGSIG